MNLPTKHRPQRGLFVYQRLKALARTNHVRAMRPQPWFPGLRNGPIDPPINDTALKVDCRRMFYIPGVFKSLDGFWMQRCLEKWLEEIHSNPNETVLDAHFGYPEGVACWRTAQKMGMKYCITIRGLESRLFGVSRIRPQLIQALNSANGIIAVSHSLRDLAVQNGVRKHLIQVIPNGIDRRIFCPGDQQLAREQVGFDRNGRLLVCVANLMRVKGHDVLLRAMARLRKDRSIQLVCIGADGDSGSQLRKMIVDLNLSQSVSIIGSKPPECVANWLRAADLFVLASRREGCCNAILEAAACGVPIVATRVGDNSVYVREGINGRLVDSDRDDELASAICDQLGCDRRTAELESEQANICDWTEIGDKVSGFIASWA